jgi:predicted RNA-binding Zn ribbon-like protein
VLNETEPAKRAPEPLRLVQQFLNSVEYTGGVAEEEDLSDTKALRRWLRDRDLISAQAKVTQADLRHAIEVREGLRDLLAGNGGHAVSPESVARLDEASSRCGLRATFAPDEPPRLEANCTDVDGGIARLLAIVATAAADGSWQRLKACADDGCRWAYYDHSKNRSGRWCSMETCGNRNKARASRARTSGQGSKKPATGKARS